MVRRYLLPALLLAAAPALAQPVSTEALRRHIDVLASDAFEGREPGTEGEKKTIAYISQRLAALGLEPAAEGGSWYQPVELLNRRPGEHSSLFRARKKRNHVALDRDSLIFLGRDERHHIESAPVVFAGHGAPDQLGKADLKGAVVLILFQGPKAAGFPGYAERVKAVMDRGAAAVVAIMDKDAAWPQIQRYYDAGQTRLAGDRPAGLAGAMSHAAAEQLFRAGRADFTKALQAAPMGFIPVHLKLKADLDVATSVKTIASHNVIGRLRGSAPDGQSLLYLGHWDHIGICEPESAEDRICNGAVDNASGIAVMIEVAAALAKRPRPKRDVLFLATTAEEMGLLGARHFAAKPVVPLSSIAAAVNMDTVAIAERGEKVAVIGRGHAPLDALIASTAGELGRAMDEDKEADGFIQRQDGWALTQAGVPSIMIGGSFSDMKKLQAFLGSAYHSAADNPVATIPLGGAAEDADLMIALGRKLADPAIYPNPKRP